MPIHTAPWLLCSMTAPLHLSSRLSIQHSLLLVVRSRNPPPTPLSRDLAYSDSCYFANGVALQQQAEVNRHSRTRICCFTKQALRTGVFH